MTAESVDIALFQDKTTGLYDISFTDGDFTLVDNFDTSITVSLMTDARANSTQEPRAELRRGWWGNQFSDSFPDYEIGSQLWLLTQSRKVQATLNSAIDFAKSALSWLVSDNHAKAVNVTGKIDDDGITIGINIDRGASTTETKYYDLWNNTGKVV